MLHCGFPYCNKVCQGDLYQLYVDPDFFLHIEDFNNFRSLADDTFNFMVME